MRRMALGVVVSLALTASAPAFADSSVIREDRPDPVGDAWRQGADAPRYEAHDGTRRRRGELHAVAIEANPLAALIGRYSLQVEWLPLAHHALVVNPHFDYTTASIGSYHESFTGFGGELGYRLYTGKTGATGFFVGPSVLAATYSASADGASQSVGFSSFGGAVDIGGQAIVADDFVIGGGFGLQYTKATKDLATDGLPLSAEIIAGGGVRPRFLLAAGYTF